MPATLLARIAVINEAAVVRIDAAKCSSSQFPRTRSIRGPKFRQALRSDGFSLRAKQVLSLKLRHGAKGMVCAHASSSQDWRLAMHTRAVSVERPDEPTDKGFFLWKPVIVAYDEVEGNKKWSSESQAIFPKVGSEAAAGSGVSRVSRSVQAELLFPLKGFKRCMGARKGFGAFVYVALA